MSSRLLVGAVLVVAFAVLILISFATGVGESPSSTGYP